MLFDPVGYGTSQITHLIGEEGDMIKRGSRLLIEVREVFPDFDGVRRARGDAAHAAYALLHVGDLDPLPRVLKDPPWADVQASPAVDTLVVVDEDLMQLSRLPAEK